MARASKSISKNSNSKFTTRNNKQDIFSKIAKTSKLKSEVKTHADEVSKVELEETEK